MLLIQDNIFKLFYSSVQDVGEQLHRLLQEQSLVDDTDKTTRDDALVGVLLPIRVSLFFQHSHKIIFSIEMVKHINLNKHEFIYLKQYAIEKNLPTQEALVELLRKTISNHENVKSIIHKYLSKKKPVVVSIELWRDMDWQE